VEAESGVTIVTYTKTCLYTLTLGDELHSVNRGQILPLPVRPCDPDAQGARGR
jgi:hypothetical protein